MSYFQISPFEACEYYDYHSRLLKQWFNTSKTVS
jgi:hypothetical protein